MPKLCECFKCGEQVWDYTPTPAGKLLSPHVMQSAQFCPSCGTDFGLMRKLIYGFDPGSVRVLAQKFTKVENDDLTDALLDELRSRLSTPELVSGKPTLELAKLICGDLLGGADREDVTRSFVRTGLPIETAISLVLGVHEDLRKIIEDLGDKPVSTLRKARRKWWQFWK